jgi:hypothetical protein
MLDLVSFSMVKDDSYEHSFYGPPYIYFVIKGKRVRPKAFENSNVYN